MGLAMMPVMTYALSSSAAEDDGTGFVPHQCHADSFRRPWHCHLCYLLEPIPQN